MKLRILKKYDVSGEPYYIVQKRILFFIWKNLWPNFFCADDCEMFWDRTFKTQTDAEAAIDVFKRSRLKPNVVMKIEI